MFEAFLISLLFCGSNGVEEKKGWILNSPEYYCDDKCRFKLQSSSKKRNLSGCIDDDALSLSKAKQAQIGKCLRVKNGLKQLTTTGVPRQDYRISCRPSKDRMAWYRGWQSLTFHGKPCIRWDEAPVKFPLESFYNVSAPSVDYTTLKVFSTTISQHEDYCRNPDNHQHGPWCFYLDDEKEIRRAPCFHTCITDIKKFCLAKAFFPFFQTPYLLSNAPLSPVDPHFLRSITDKKLKAQNERVDLSDILDVHDVIQSIGQVTPLYSITLTARHLTQARLAGNAVVIRKKCHQTGIRTLIAGPWTPIKDDLLKFPEDSDSTKSTNEILRDFMRVQFLAGRQGIDKPWKPCFTACEDNTITCWPNQTTLNLNQRLFYFGNRAVNRNERMCIMWTKAMSVLYKHNARYQVLLEDDVTKKPSPKGKGKKSKSAIDVDLKLQVFYYRELTERRAIGGKMGVNRFLDGGGRLLHSSVCLDLARLIERDETSGPKNQGEFQAILEDAYHSMYFEGPGCFSWIDESYIKYVPCFHPCPCGSEAMKPPFKPYRDMCEKKNHEWEPCAARRDAREILLRQHDEKVEPLPPAEARGLYIPLIITVVSAAVCFFISFLDQMGRFVFR
ncbi:hypothetical protein RB195_011668 [Necator americanus]|uniref:Kringle domain-containing protein n=1 Tax=Necator americanus TaxID=51031 RepID=A0ABR1D3I1_NECAM